MAIYQQYKLGNRDMRWAVGHVGLQLDCRLFNQAIQSLQTEGLICGAVLVKNRLNNYVEQVILNRVGLTHRGLLYVRNNILNKKAE